MGGKRRTKPAPKQPVETRGINERGQEWEAEKLTGNRLQKGLVSVTLCIKKLKKNCMLHATGTCETPS